RRRHPSNRRYSSMASSTSSRSDQRARTLQDRDSVHKENSMRRMTLRGWTMAAVGACVVALGATVAAQNLQINGAGATFPEPVYQKWFSEYNKLHANIRINYQAVGSGAGIRQLTAQTVFFGASDAPMTNDQMLATPGPVLHFPSVLGAV